MKTIKLFYTCLLFINVCVFAQTTEDERFLSLLKHPPTDTAQLMRHVKICHTYLFRQPDSAIIYGRQIIHEAIKMAFPKAESRALNIIGQALRLTGDMPQSMETHLQALQLSRQQNDPEEVASSLALIGVVYIQLDDFQKGFQYLRQSLAIQERTPTINILVLSNMGDAYEKMNNMDSALFFQVKAYRLLPGVRTGSLHSLVMMRMGIIEARLKNKNKAMSYYRQALENAILSDDLLNCSRVQYRIAELYYQAQQQDSCQRYARLAYCSSKQVSHQLTLLSVSHLLVRIFKDQQQTDSAFYYQQVAMAVNDSLFGPAKYQRLQLLALSEQQGRQQLMNDQRLSEVRTQKIVWSLVLAVIVLIAILLWRRNLYQKGINRSLRQKNSQIEHQKNLLQKTLADLEHAQSEIIEKEKLAALYRQQLQVQQVRNNIAAELHDDIGSTLSSIRMFSEVAKKQINKDHSLAEPMLDKIQTSSQEMMLSMNEIVWSIQSKNDEVEKLVEKIHSFASQLLAASNILFQFDYPEQMAAIPLDMECRRNIYLICKETLNNIVRHSQATEVLMVIKLEEKSLMLEIKDNGCGFDTGKTFTGNGLQHLYHRADQIGGHLRIESLPGKGTCINFQCRLAE